MHPCIHPSKVSGESSPHHDGTVDHNHSPTSNNYNDTGRTGTFAQHPLALSPSTMSKKQPTSSNLPMVLVPLAFIWRHLTSLLLIGILTIYLEVGVLNRADKNGLLGVPTRFTPAAVAAAQYETQQHHAFNLPFRNAAAPSNRRSGNNNDHVCIHLTISLNLTSFTLPFAKGALEWMVNSALGSLQNQTIARTAWPTSWQTVVFIIDDTASDTLLEEHMDMVAMTLTDPIRSLQQEGIHVYMTENTRKKREAAAPMPLTDPAALIKENPQCRWIAKIRLDADDILAPGFFEYLANDVVVDILEGTRTAEGDPWLGAVVASRTLNKLFVGKHICHASLMEGNLFSGFSVGQTIIVSADTFAALGHKIVGGDLGTLGQLFRNDVARKVLHDPEYSSRAGSLPVVNKMTNSSEAGFRELDDVYDLIDAARSRVMILDSKATFGKVHPYLITPLSGSFPWGWLDSFPACDMEQMERVKATFNYSVEFAFIGASTFQPVELVDACQSNSFFPKTQKPLFEQGEDCFQMAARRAKSKMSPFFD